MEIYINKNGQQMGPFDELRVREMIRSGQLSPNDLAIRPGDTQWQTIASMFPAVSQPTSMAHAPVKQTKVQSGTQPTPAKPGRSKGLMFGLIGCGGLLLIAAVLVVIAFVASSRPRSDNSVSTNSNKNTPVATPSRDPFKETEISKKKDELLKLAPPVQLNPNAIIKGKVHLAYSDQGSENQGLSFSDVGLSYDRQAEDMAELETVIQVVCRKGGLVGTYEGGVKGYGNDCTASLIDYKASATIAQKTFANHKPFDAINKYRVTSAEYVMPFPKAEISAWLQEFRVDKVVAGLTTLTNEEHGRLGTTEKLDPAGKINQKLGIITRFSTGDSMEPKYQNFVDFGLPSSLTSTGLDEINTLAKVMCQKGDRIGNVGNTVEFANKCEVQLIDFKTMTVFAKKIIENRTVDPSPRQEKFKVEWLVAPPKKEIGEYIKQLVQN